MIFLLKRFGIDSAIRYVLLGRGTTIVSGILVLLLVSTQLTPAQQGVYYVFSSIVSLQIIFELGLSTVIVQFASHEVSHLKFISSQQHIEGPPRSKSRLYSLIRLSIKWYLVVGLLIVIVLGPAGYIFFNNELTDNFWKMPWFVLVVSTGINIACISITSVYEGCGFVKLINKLRLLQSIIAGVLSVAFLLTGYGLLATSSVAIAGVLVFGYFIKNNCVKLIKTSFSYAAHSIDNISWKKEILPMQWRIALSWISGYFIFFIINPIAFKSFGPVFSGQLGMTMSVCNMVLTIGLAWVTTKNPYWGTLIAKNNREELDESFDKAFKQSIFFVTILLVGGCFLTQLLGYFGFALAERFLPLKYFMLIALAIIGNHLIACLATYIRAHKVEKMTTASLIMAALITLLLTTTAYYNSPGLYIASYTFLIWVYFVPYTLVIFKKFKTCYEK